MGQIFIGAKACVQMVLENDHDVGGGSNFHDIINERSTIGLGISIFVMFIGSSLLGSQVLK